MRAAVGTSGVTTLSTPSIAGVMGMISALLLGAVMVLVRVAIPAASTSADWVTDASSREAVAAALSLVPFVGIFFLWFMGAVRDYFGEGRNSFFDTLFLGAGLLFVALLFVISAATYGLLTSADASQNSSQVEHWRQLVLTLLSGYSTRMAAVLTLSATTIGRGLGIFPRWLVWLGYLVALTLFFVNVPWSELVFPVWVFVLSGHIFLTRQHRSA